MKMIKFFATVSIVAMIGMGFSSCGGGDDNPADKTTQGSGNEGGGNEGGGGTTVGDTPMSKSEQTDFLESTAHELITMAPASDFEELTDMAKDARNINSKNLDNWFGDIFEKTIEKVSETLDNSYVGSYYSSFYYTRNYKAAFEIANYKGHFEVQNGKWQLVQSDVDDLKFTFKDSKNDTWVLRAEATGPFKKVHMFALRDRNYEYSYSNNNNVYKSYTDITQCVISIPKSTVVTLTKNGTQKVKTTVNAELSDITGEEFDISKNDISVSVVVEVKDYKIDVSQVVYKHNNSANVSTVVSKGSKKMLTASVTSTLSGVPSVNVSAFTNNFDPHIFEYTEGNAIIKLDILGKVQVQGKVTKVHALADILENARKQRESESDFKSDIREANEHLELGLFYNNKSLKQANVYLEPFEQTGYRYTWNGSSSSYTPYKYWVWDMVIQFGDDSSYSTMANYFSKSNFRSVYGDIEALIDSYSKLVKK